MRRTQICIDEGTYKILEKESKITGKTISELIRESIRSRVQKKADEILRRLEDVYGIWKDREFADALIGATTKVNGFKLWTLNKKHYHMLEENV